MKTRKEIAVIVHGPEAVDSGLALRVMETASSLGHVRAMVGGATAVAAVIDAGLEGTISIGDRELPSLAITRALNGSDLVLLVNHGKGRVSALAFGRLVMSRVPRTSIPVVQVDDGLTIIWSGDDPSLTGVAPLFGNEVLDLRGEPKVSAESCRRLSGVVPGENIWIDGHVIGRATREEVLICQGPAGELQVEGIELKPTGVQRLGRFDLPSAIIRSGQVRRTRATPRSLRSKGGVACLIDHCAEEAVYRCRDAAYVVTVGDDTSKIAAALLYRLGVPVIAITDGDEDGISSDDILYPGSYVFRLLPGNDDLVGAMIAAEHFSGGHRVELRSGIEEMAGRVRAACGDRLLWERRF
jgi:hypothetical protein